MKNTRYAALLTVICIIMEFIGITPVSAGYSSKGGVITWNFAEYTSEKTGATIGSETEDYEGLIIRLAENNVNDKITTSGVAWNGKSTNGNRYISYTPTENGILHVVGTMKKGRWGIVEGSATAVFVGDSSSTNLTGIQEVYKECEAGKTYFIYSRDDAAAVSKVWYATSSEQEVSPSPTVSLEPEIPITTELPNNNDFTDPDNDGIYDWDFSYFTNEWSGYAGAEKTGTFITHNYEGLILSIGWQNDAGDRDKVTSSGIYWRGASTGRYIYIKAPEDGVLIVDGTGLWKVANTDGGTSLGTTKIKCQEDEEYYIYPTASKTGISHIQFITTRASLPATATLNNMYGDNMLLQRGKPIKLDGFSEYASEVTLNLTNDNDNLDTQTKKAPVSNDKWSITFDSISNYTDTYTLTITPTGDETASSEETTTITNIKFGDLYLCGGQSNMQWHLIQYLGLDGYPEYATDDYTKDEIDKCANSNIRILQLPNASDTSDTTHSAHCESIANGCEWQELSSDAVYHNYIPAMVYSIATKLQAETDIPIGILSTAVGGTTIAQWLENTGVDKDGQNYNAKRNWYNGRIYPLRNFTLSGIFWYQGCSDKDNGADYYEKRMTELINTYRGLFGDNTLPFYYVQLARNGIVYPETTNKEGEDNTGMRDVRNAQANVYFNMEDKSNLGFVSTLDIYGTKEYKSSTKNVNSNARVNYHTGQKPEIAKRLVDLALKDIYMKDIHKDDTAVYTHGPRYKSHHTEGNRLIVEFDTTGNLKVMDTKQYSDDHSAEVWEKRGIDTTKIQEFEIAGNDGEYYPAEAQISGNTLILTSSKVTDPVSLRYAYSAYPECPNLTDDTNLPTYAFAAEKAEEIQYPSWKFDFGIGDAQEGFTRVSKSQTYGADGKDYGFLGLDETSAGYKAVVDGYDQRNGNYTTLKEGEGYVKSADEQFPIRFAMKVKPNTYYKVKVTLTAKGGDAKAFLTSERRHFILTDEAISDGGTLTKEFTVAVHDVRWKNRDGEKATEEKYEDDMLNIGLLGENAALKTIEIQQIAKPKVLWIFGDSTVTDHVAEVPVSSSADEAGWGAAAAKYVNEDVAVINLSEGGLVTGSKAYFEQGRNDMTTGDVLLLQFGHNENQSNAAEYTKNLDYYNNAVTAAGAKLVICSPIQRLEAGNQNGPWKETAVDTIYPEAAKAYAETHTNVEYIDLNKLTKEQNESLGVRAWYLHRAYWQMSAGGAEPTAVNDPTHLNDYGADNACRMAMTILASLTDGYVNKTMGMAIMPSDSVMKNGGTDYVMPPYKGNNKVFPYPTYTDFEHEVEILDEIIENGVLNSVKIKRNVELSYITVFAAAYKDGALTSIASKRLEPSSAASSETVDFSQDSIVCPEDGEVRVFVWDGAFIDNTMTMRPLSEVAVYKRNDL